MRRIHLKVTYIMKLIPFDWLIKRVFFQPLYMLRICHEFNCSVLLKLLLLLLAVANISFFTIHEQSLVFPRAKSINYVTGMQKTWCLQLCVGFSFKSTSWSPFAFCFVLIESIKNLCIYMKDIKKLARPGKWRMDTLKWMNKLKLYFRNSLKL